MLNQVVDSLGVHAELDQKHQQTHADEGCGDKEHASGHHDTERVVSYTTGQEIRDWHVDERNEQVIEPNHHDACTPSPRPSFVGQFTVERAGHPYEASNRQQEHVRHESCP